MTEQSTPAEMLTLSSGGKDQIPDQPACSSAQVTGNQTSKDKTIGQYILGKSIGEGTFGKVKLGTHILTKENVAVKILEKDKIVDVADVERVSREIHILKVVRHPQIVQLYEIIETQKKLYLIMEYCTGGELFDYIVQNQRVKEKEACQFLQQIIAGVEYISRLNIVHRDLKPENMLLDYDKGIKLVDFGLSNTYKNKELLKTACGSPCYAAPEMIAGKKYHGTNVDIWSCGVILFALVCGYLPFEDPNTSNLYKKILSADFTIPRFVSREAQDIITCILNTDPEKRYTIEDIRKHPWFNLVPCNQNSKGTIMGIDPTPIDPVILNSLKGLGINTEYARKCIEANKHNHITATYYLLLKKHLRNGGESIADVSSPKYDPSVFLKRQANFSDLINLNKTTTTKQSGQIRGSSQEPTRLRKIADGLGDLDRQSDHRRKQQRVIQRRRVESLGGTLNLQDYSEIITSTNLKDINASNDRSPSVSPSTVRVSKQFHNDRNQAISNALFYHNYDCATPSTNMQTSVTPNRMMGHLATLPNQGHENNTQTLYNNPFSSIDPLEARYQEQDQPKYQKKRNQLNQNNGFRPQIQIPSQFNSFIKSSSKQGISNNSCLNTDWLNVSSCSHRRTKPLVAQMSYCQDQNNSLLNASQQMPYLYNQSNSLLGGQFNTMTPHHQKREHNPSDVGISYIPKSSLAKVGRRFQNPTPQQIMASVMAPNAYPRESKSSQQKQLISSALRRRRYKNDNSSFLKKDESPKSLITRKQDPFLSPKENCSLLNMYKGPSITQQPRKSQHRQTDSLALNQSSFMGNKPASFDPKSGKGSSGFSETTKVPLNFQYLNSSINDSIQKHKKDKSQMNGHSVEPSRGKSLPKPKKGLYIPNANINMVEKNPMNITIYNIRNSSQGAVTQGDSVNQKVNSKGHHRQQQQKLQSSFLDSGRAIKGANNTSSSRFN